MVHSIINQKGNYIDDQRIRDEVDHCLAHDLTHTYFEKTKIEIKSSYLHDDKRTTVVIVEGI